MYDLGDVVHLAIEVKDASTPPQLVDSTVTLTLTLPDQNTVALTPVAHPSLGEYNYDYTTVQAGRHVARWTGSSATFAQTQIFDVETADMSIVSLADVKTQLQKKTSTLNDEELRSYILSASENIEATHGICAVRSFTERVYGAHAFRLTNTPVVSLTSFTPIYPWTPAVAVADVDINKESGVITRLDGWEFFGPYDVTYKAGRAVIPSSLRTACLMIVQHLWATRRGQGVPSGGDDLVTLPGWNYAIPARAAQLMDSVPQPAGFA